MWKFVILAVLMAGLYFILYNSGYMVMKSLRAVTFVGSPKGKGATFTSCTGSVRRIVRFKESGTLRYFLDAELSKGDISVEFLDADKQSIMKLNQENCHGTISVESKKKYYFIVKFQSASGRYSLVRE